MIEWYNRLSEDVKEIGPSAFQNAKIPLLRFHCSDVVLEDVTSLLHVPFEAAEIYELDISDDVKEIPDYCFAYAKFQMSELTLKVEQIGIDAFLSAWKWLEQKPDSSREDRIIIMDSVQYIWKQSL